MEALTEYESTVNHHPMHSVCPLPWPITQALTQASFGRQNEVLITNLLVKPFPNQFADAARAHFSVLLLSAELQTNKTGVYGYNLLFMVTMWIIGLL